MTDIIIIGGGIVGLATGKKLLEKRPCRLRIFEAEDRLAAHQTGNNSGVIHSGLYYAPGSLKAHNCVSGREELYRFCAENGIPHDPCGKIVVAVTPAEIDRLHALEERGRANGLKGLRRLSAAELPEYEPFVRGQAGLLVPETGIVDFSNVCAVLARQIQEKDGQIQLHTRVTGIQPKNQTIILQTTQGEFETRYLINCAGLQSDRVARLSGCRPEVKIVPFRGEYYEFVPDKRFMVRNLIYPVPDPQFPFLGVHFTRMIDGRVEAGPNAVLAFQREGYAKLSFSLRDAAETLVYPGFWRIARKHWAMGLGEYYRSFSKAAFIKALQKMMPEMTAADLQPGGAGVRAQAVTPFGKLVDDFHIVDEERMIHVLNAPSPAATAALGIGEHVATMAVRNFRL